ncbi:MAG: F0F1 ATP synthase subunit B [Anaerolineae bacterium]|nr:F0F1 ATP synthase subunit B [Anaerolineae bacterium]
MDALGLNAGFLIAQFVNFGVIILLLATVAWKPLTRTLDDRAMKIAKQLEDAEVAAKARQNAEAEAAKIIEDARREAAKFADEARARGEESAKGLVGEARAEADKLLADARKKAESERDRQLADLRDQVAGLAIAASKKLIGESLDEKRQRDLVKKFFTEVPQEARNVGGTVEVVSALPLTADEQAEVKKMTGASEVVYSVDPDIMGGLVLRAGGRVIDGSVRAGMRDIASRLN